MTKVKRGYIARKSRTKIHLFASTFIGAHLKLTRTAKQQKMRVLVSSHQDRGRKMRDFHHLWIARINVAVHENGVFYNYSRLIHNLYKK